MSHDEIPINHTNASDLSPVDAIAYALGVPMPAAVETIVERIERLLAAERSLQRASERIAELEALSLYSSVNRIIAERDKALAGLAEERSLVRRLFDELRGGS
jgi:hypothetical protein